MKPTNNLYRLGIKALFEAVVLNEVQGRGAYTGGRSGTARPSSKTKASESAPEARPGEPVVRATGDGTSEEDAALQRKTNAAQDAMKAATTPSDDEGGLPKDFSSYPAATNRRGKKEAETKGGKPTDRYDTQIAGTTVNKVLAWRRKNLPKP